MPVASRDRDRNRGRAFSFESAKAFRGGAERGGVCRPTDLFFIPFAGFFQPFSFHLSGNGGHDIRKVVISARRSGYLFIRPDGGKIFLFLPSAVRW
jgi:hypothetical protein